MTKTSLGMGAVTLGSLLNTNSMLGNYNSDSLNTQLRLPHFAPKAKRVIYLFQSGAPSQLDIFDYKPTLVNLTGKELPSSVRGDQRLTGMTAGQATFPMVGSIFNFKQHGQSGAWMSDLMPYTSKIVDDLCFIKSMHTSEINHDPAVTFLQSGSNLPGDHQLALGLATD